VKRILLLSHVSEIGGAEHSLLTLVSHLPCQLYDVHVALPETDSPLGRSLMKHKAEVHGAPYLQILRRRDPMTPLKLLWGRIKLAGLADEVRPDIIHANTDVPMMYAAALHRRGRHRAGSWRIVWHLRDMRRSGRWTRYLHHRSDARIAVSEAVLEHHGLKRSKRNRVIYNGVDLSRFQPGPDPLPLRRELGIDPAAFVCLCVGQAVSWKNLDVFAEMNAGDCERVLIAYPPPGGGSEVTIESRKGLHVLGYRDDMPAVYAASDLLVHPAMGEAFGRTVVEAMACGVPVVAYRHGGPAETVEDGVSGLLVTPDSPGELAEAVTRVASDPGLHAALARGAAERAREFSAEDHAALIDQLYDALAQEAKA
jgi:glycosyltransferase involved in cell wall biosynthesis